MLFNFKDTDGNISKVLHTANIFCPITEISMQRIIWKKSKMVNKYLTVAFCTEDKQKEGREEGGREEEKERR